MAVALSSQQSYLDQDVKLSDELACQKAGIVLWKITPQQNGIALLMGIEENNQCLTFFGGKRTNNDKNPIKAAIRGFNEETGGLLCHATLTFIEAKLRQGKKKCVFWHSEWKSALYICNFEMGGVGVGIATEFNTKKKQAQQQSKILSLHWIPFDLIKQCINNNNNINISGSLSGGQKSQNNNHANDPKINIPNTTYSLPLRRWITILLKQHNSLFKYLQQSNNQHNKYYGIGGIGGIGSSNYINFAATRITLQLMDSQGRIIKQQTVGECLESIFSFQQLANVIRLLGFNVDLNLNYIIMWSSSTGNNNNNYTNNVGDEDNYYIQDDTDFLNMKQHILHRKKGHVLLKIMKTFSFDDDDSFGFDEDFKYNQDALLFGNNENSVPFSQTQYTQNAQNMSNFGATMENFKSNGNYNLNGTGVGNYNGQVIWQWRNDIGVWKDYTPNNSALIETKMGNIASFTNNGSFQMNIFNKLYTIDLINKTQTNIVTKATRDIRRFDPSKALQLQGINSGNVSGYGYNKNNYNNKHNLVDASMPSRQWQWNEGNLWHNFDQSTNAFVENNRLQNQNVFVCTINNKDYVIDLIAMTQVNAHTNYQRKIRFIANSNGNINNSNSNYSYNNNNNNNNNKNNSNNNNYGHSADAIGNMHQNANGNGNKSSFVKWQYKVKGDWYDFNKCDSISIENARINGQNIVKLTINKKNYQIDIGQLSQTNLQSKTVREIRSVPNSVESKTKTAVSKGSSYTKWQWLTDDKKLWMDFNKKDSILIENTRQKGQNTIQLTINKKNYEIDISKLHQKNPQSGNTRSIRCVPNTVPTKTANTQPISGTNTVATSSNYMKWQWLDDNQTKWFDFIKQDSIKIEQARQNYQNTIQLTINKQQYDINVSQLYQKSVKTGTIRSIRCVPHTVPDGSSNHGGGGGSGNGPIIVGGKGKGGKGPGGNGGSNKSSAGAGGGKWTGPKRKTFGTKIMTLYHVTGKAGADGIKKSNKMLRGSKGKFGGGIYFAESAKVAKSKAHFKGYLITCLVLVGEEHTIDQLTNITFGQLCKLKKDSVWSKKYSERVVYNYDQCKVLSIKPA